MSQRTPSSSNHTLINRWLHLEQAESADLGLTKRSTLIVWFAFGLFAMSLVLLVGLFITYRSWNITATITSVGTVSSLVLLTMTRWKRALPWIGMCIPLMASLFYFMSAMQKGGLGAVAILGFMTIPLIGGFLVGGRASLWFGGLMTAFIFVLYGLYLFQYPFPEGYTIAQRQSVSLVGSLLVVWLVSLFTWLYEKNNLRMQELAEERLTQLYLTNEQLRIAAEQAQSANETKNVFLAHMTHELRTPLNGILGMNELMLATAQNDEQREFATSIRHSTEHLLSIVSDVLDYSQVKSGKLALHMQQCDPRTPLFDAMETLQPDAESQGLTVTCTVESNVPATLQNDSTCIQRILLSLLHNAIKYTPQGHVEVKLARIDQPDNTSWLRYEINDTGIGIDLDTQQNLFEPFVQVDLSMTREYGGMGLGLAISNDLANMLGGKLGVTSTPGKGSCFWLDLPLKEQKPKTPQPRTRHTTGSQPAWQEPPDTPAHILIVEDDPVSRKMLQILLTRMGYKTTLAHDGREGLDKACTQSFDLILMDCRMPHIDGYEATRHIRAHHAPLPGPPIIAVTAQAIDDDRNLCLTSGMNDYLSKPYRPQELKDMIEKWLSPTLWPNQEQETETVMAEGGAN